MDAVALGELGHQIAILVSSDQFLLLGSLKAALSLRTSRAPLNFGGDHVVIMLQPRTDWSLYDSYY
jgi:hypothetical protein